MTDKTWKAVERRVAEYLGGDRVPVTGRQRGSAPDVAHDDLGIEIKHRERLPGWIHDAYAQAVACSDGDQTPVVILHEKGARVGDCYAVMRLSDLRGRMCRGLKFTC